MLRGSRREALGGALVVGLLSTGADKVRAVSLESPFEWGFLWGGGSMGAAAPPKRRGLAATEVATSLRKDLKESRYILTGNLDPSIFADDCRFVDPNNAVDGLERYRRALSALFDPAQSSLELLDLRIAPGGASIEADYVASGTLKLPWRPRIAPWSGHIEYTLGNDGLVRSQVDVWNITRFDAIRQTFTPGLRD